MSMSVIVRHTSKLNTLHFKQQSERLLHLQSFRLVLCNINFTYLRYIPTPCAVFGHSVNTRQITYVEKAAPTGLR